MNLDARVSGWPFLNSRYAKGKAQVALAEDGVNESSTTPVPATNSPARSLTAKTIVPPGFARSSRLTDARVKGNSCQALLKSKKRF